MAEENKAGLSRANDFRQRRRGAVRSIFGKVVRIEGKNFLELRACGFRGWRRYRVAQDNAGNGDSQVERQLLPGGDHFPSGTRELATHMFGEDQDVVRHDSYLSSWAPFASLRARSSLVVLSGAKDLRSSRLGLYAGKIASLSYLYSATLAQVLPRRIVRYDQRNLLRPKPTLDLLLPVDGDAHILKTLEVHEPVDVVLPGEPRD